MFGGRQRPYQALRCASLEDKPLIQLTITNQQCKDVKDKLGGLIPWLDTLLDTLAKVDPNQDREEVERRSQLTKSASCLESSAHPKLTPCDRSLEDVQAKAEALFEKGKIARFLDRTQDLGEVIALVERLRQAILIYQVRQCQSQSASGVANNWNRCRNSNRYTTRSLI